MYLIVYNNKVKKNNKEKNNVHDLYRFLYIN